MIIDIHGRYTSAPNALETWRDRRIAAAARVTFVNLETLLRVHFSGFARLGRMGTRHVSGA